MKKEKTALVIPNAVQVGNLCANNLEFFLNSLKSQYFGPIAQQILSDNTPVFLQTKCLSFNKNGTLLRFLLKDGTDIN